MHILSDLEVHLGKRFIDAKIFVFNHSLEREGGGGGFLRNKIIFKLLLES